MTNLTSVRSLNDLVGYRIAAEDGEIGKVHDFFFDDEIWSVRYMVVDTGHWLPGRKVLLSPSVIKRLDWEAKSFGVALTREKVKTSPDIDTDKPVSRQREIELATHYNWTPLWTAEGAWPAVTPMVSVLPPTEKAGKASGDPHLRSLRELTGYRVEATDGDIGFVDDLLAENETWVARYLVISTHKWIPGRKVLISPQWMVGPISWSTKTVKVFMTRESVQRSPEYDPRKQLDRNYESDLHEHYDRPKYWVFSGKIHVQEEPHTSSGTMKNTLKEKPKRSAAPKAAPHTVHFEITNRAAHKVCLAGNFNDWRPERTEMVPLGGGRFEKDLVLAPGTYEYRIVVDGKWMADPNADHSVINPFGERNSVLTVD